MTNDDPSSVPRQLALWIEMLGPPVLWLMQFEVRYALVPWCCANGTRYPLWAASVGSLILGAVMVVMSCVSWKHSVSSELMVDATIGQRRARFMATVGLMSSTLFFMVMAAQAIPVAFIDPCIQ